MLKTLHRGVQFVSCEPLLGRIEPSILTAGIHWVIIGAENAVKPRQMEESWVREIVAGCEAKGVPVFYKQKMKDGKLVKLPNLDGNQHTEFPQITDRLNES